LSAPTKDELFALVRAYLDAPGAPVRLRGAGLIGMVAATLAAEIGARDTAELLWGCGDKTIELAPPEAGEGRR
jgi:hypothetical protein